MAVLTYKVLKENESQSTDCSCTCHLILGWVLIDRSILSSSLGRELAVERFGNLDVWFYLFLLFSEYG